MLKIRSKNLRCMAAGTLLLCVSLPSSALAEVADDRAAIEDLHGRYLFAFDWQDADAYAATFAPNGILNYGGGEIRGREAISAFIEEGRARTEQTRANTPEGERPPVGRHIISNIVIEVEGDRARSLAYWTHMTSDATGYGTVDFFGHYEDELVKIDGEWLYARRHIYNQAIPEWEAQHANPVDHPSPPPRERSPSGS